MINLYNILIELSDTAGKLLENQLYPQKNKEDLLLFAVGKTEKTSKAIVVLCEKGFGQDAAMLSRSLFELALTVDYIISDKSDYLVKRFFAYDWVQRAEAYDYLKNYDDQYIDVKKNADIADETYKYKKGLGWSDIRISKMANDCGWGNMYKTIYKILCAFTHVNTRSFNDYLKMDELGNFLVDSGPNTSLIDETLVLSAYSYLQILYYFDNYFNKDYKSHLKKIEEKIIEICSIKGLN